MSRLRAGDSTSAVVEIRKSICTMCDPQTQCGLDLHILDGEIVKVEGSLENPHNVGSLCSKGAATRQYVYNKERLKTPLRRIGPRGSGLFEPISWDEALDEVASKLQGIKGAYGPEAVAFFAGYPKWMRPYLKRLAHSFGSPNFLTESSTCAQAMMMAQKLNGTPGFPDIKNSRCLLVWSSNPFYSNTCLARQLLKAKQNGMKIITVDPRITPMTAQSDLHLQLKPGTDGALALSMANVILLEGLYDAEFIRDHTHGFDEFQRLVEQYPPETGEAITGVPREKIREAARLYAGTKPAGLMPYSSAVVHHTNGVQNYRAVFTLIALTGNYDVKGGNMALPPSYLYISAGFATRMDEFSMPKRWEDMAPRIGQDRFPVWSELVPEAQAMHLPVQIASEVPYPVKAVLGFGMNHRMWPDSPGFLKQLESLDFIVNVDLFLTDTCNWADIVLPACSSVERSELRCYPENYVILTQPAINPLYESRSDVEIIYNLAKRLQLADPLFDAGYEASLDWILEPSGLTVRELKKYPGGMPVPAPQHVPEKKYLNRGFPTPSGKMEFSSLLLERHGHPGVPLYLHPEQSAAKTPELAAKFPLVLNTGSRLPMFVHSRTFRLPWTKSLRPAAAADMNPSDAVRFGIKQDDAIRLSTPKGSIKVRANLTEMVQPGVVHMYHAYRDADVNSLIDADYLDPISGFPGFKSLLCKIDRLET
ncbi:molybdopterin-containing oxidoreductase family protein [Geobacter argillaceus]|uniref:Anaerobic selenocysteine-containing dehydrogenase n=1 Tax=Geobacter argillaceus TaxID=345631 RepID=A0A562VLK9_9BACT|nr:molybdopterin-dependent oxidoreductase [Geobacter argillaceus]TWJ18809.1 anaerobic selenocysteine-containing dehydrogenase [Geobacter argillaceus]